MSQSRKNSVADGRKAGRTDGAEFARLLSKTEGPTSVNHFSWIIFSGLKFSMTAVRGIIILDR